MKHTFASRVLELRKLKGLSQQAFAERCGLEQGNISQMEKGTEPKQSNVTKLIAGFPDLSPDWLLLGTGPMLRDGRALTPLPPGPAGDEPPPAAPAAAAAPAFSGEVLDKLLAQINRQAQQHREELALLKREARAQLSAQTKFMQYTIDAMVEKVYYLEGRLGLRALAPGEAAALAVDAPRAAKIGLKHYDETPAPTGRHRSLFGPAYRAPAPCLAA